MMKRITLALGLLYLSFSASAQSGFLPQPSTTQTVEQEFGLGKVKLTYARPNVKERKVFGALVPYGKVWRTGANSATVLTFSEEVKLAGKTVPAGSYALFTIPGEAEWTIILSKTTEQWGSYAYKEADDFLRVKVKPAKAAQKVESFTIQFANVQAGSMDLQLAWDNTLVSVPFTTDFDTKAMANIEAAMKGDKKPYFPAAIYYYTYNKDLKQALAWVNEAEKTMGKAPWVKLWKAKIQLKLGDKKAALLTAEEGVKIAEEIKNDEYISLNKAFIAENK
ncbi:DUF2911 domain-containing protein [Pedobacter glucosidilyticus]|uniref:DUF2911 domain-containing protein n=1 Tax=Pedobacter glucosidilyticus TaxID=1122941 RepID=UPI00040CE52A|nr:DUF2911 domain-containing protein [Pedobacter glucosidilyticus]